MLLSEIWFLLIAVLFVGFIFLEGFDFGVGMATKFLAKNDLEKQMLNNVTGPIWAANQVWLITAAGAMFAAFPHWYATLFSGYYLPFSALLIVLIVRGVAFEFRDKIKTKKWVKTWDISIFIGSVIPPFLFGILFANLLIGFPIDAEMNMHAVFFDIVNLYTVTGGLLLVALTYLHGLTFISLKVASDLRRRALKAAKKNYYLTGILLIVFIWQTVLKTELFTEKTSIIVPIFIVIALLYITLLFTLARFKEVLSFLMTGLVLILLTAAVFIGMFPNVMLSSLNEAFHISLYDAASGDYSLKLMTVLSLTMLPFVLGYTVWMYYIFRKRVTDKEPLDY